MKPDRRIVSSSLSARILAHLLDAGHSQVEIAHMLGVTQGFVSLVKSRERSLTLDHVERLSDTLGMPLGAFMLAATEPAKGTKYPKKLFKSSANIVKLGDKVRGAILRGATPKST